jgi:hypothetical protein
VCSHMAIAKKKASGSKGDVGGATAINVVEVPHVMSPTHAAILNAHKHHLNSTDS